MARKEKNGSFAFQIKAEFDKMLSVGESKFLDKKADRTQNKIYSWETYRTYLKHCNYFTKWAKETHNLKTLEQAKPFINQYLELRENKGLSGFIPSFSFLKNQKFFSFFSKKICV